MDQRVQAIPLASRWLHQAENGKQPSRGENERSNDQLEFVAEVDAADSGQLCRRSDVSDLPSIHSLPNLCQGAVAKSDNATEHSGVSIGRFQALIRA
jgi:hypothetical protein